MNDKPVIEVIRETSRVLSNATEKGMIDYKIPEVMKRKLSNDVFLFSGFKTAASLGEASRLLTDEKGNVKSFDRFKIDIQGLDKKYNTNYLNAEYNFATASTQMAGKWSEFEEDGDNYNLQYRTSGDSKVRSSHAALNRTTLPPSDKFWNDYFPPNGWNCRCNVVQVRKNDYPVSNSTLAIAAGDTATAGAKKAIFRFNPGKSEQIFPEKHPYYKVNKEMREGVMKAIIKTERIEIRDFARQNLIGKTTVKFNEIKRPIEFTNTGIKEALNQPHKHFREKNVAIKRVEQLIREGEYVRFDEDIKGNVMTKGYHYIKTKINGEDSYITIKEDINNCATFYTITDKIKEKEQ